MRAFALVGIALCLAPAAASAQATRTWVSGVGDDENPCSRTAPCYSYAGALSQTAAGGVVDALDPGDWNDIPFADSNTLVITQSAELNGRFGPSDRHGLGPIVINASATDVVTLRHLHLTALDANDVAIQFNSGGVLHIEDCVIEGFVSYGILIQNSGDSQVFITDTRISNGYLTAQGIGINPQGAPVNTAVTVLGTQIDGMDSGITIGGNSALTVQGGSITDSTRGLSAAGIGGTPDVNLRGVNLFNNGTAIAVQNSQNYPLVRLSNVSALLNLAFTSTTPPSVVYTYADNRLPSMSPVCLTTPYQISQQNLDDLALGSPSDVTFTMDLGANPVDYAVSEGALPPGVSLQSGALVGSPNQTGCYEFTIAAADSFGCYGSRWFAVTLSCDTAAVSPAWLENPVEGTPYNVALHTTVNGNAGNANYTLTAGTLPPGITLNGNTLSGTPSAQGTYGFSLNSNGLFGCSADQNYSLTVGAPAPSTTGGSGGGSTTGGGASGSTTGGTTGAQPGSPDYTLALSPNPATLSNNAVATTMVTLGSANGTYADAINLACDPNSAWSCSFTPAQVSVADGTATSQLTVTFSDSSLKTASRDLLGESLGLGCIGLCLQLRRRRWGMLGIALGLVCMAGCGNVKNGTFSAQITVHATSGSIDHTQVFTVTKAVD